jgi:hypothetical protein
LPENRLYGFSRPRLKLAAKRYQAPGNGLKIKLLFQFDY